MVADKNRVDEVDIKIRFNNLCKQFENNSKYVCFDDFTIADDEDISYNMSVNNKRYEAVFYQKTSQTDSATISNILKEKIYNKYTEEELANPTEEITNDLLKMTLSVGMTLYEKSPVWFMISELYGKYCITMFYDNEYNRAQGEDL